MRLLKLFTIFALLLYPAFGLADTITKPNTFVSGTTIKASEVNENFDTIYAEFNGGINEDNIEAGGVGTSELADGCVTDTKILAGVSVSKITFNSEITLSDTANFQDDTVFDSRFVHGLDSYTAPTTDAQFAPKKYVDDQITTAVDDIQVDTAIGTTDISTNSTSYVDMADMVISDTTMGHSFTAGNAFITYSGNLAIETVGYKLGYAQIVVDGVALAGTRMKSYDTNGQSGNISSATYLTAGSHEIKVQWKSDGVTLKQYGTSGGRTLIVIQGLN